MKYKLILLFLLFSTAVYAMGQAPHLPGIIELQDQLQSQLNQMDSDLAQAAQQLSAVGIRGSATAKILQKLYNTYSSAVDIATIDLDGRLAWIEPDTYKKSIGQDISGQPHFISIQKTGKPVLSQLFKTVEGFNATSLAYPVNSAQGKPIGYVSIVFKPDAFLGNMIKKYIANLPQVEALAIQKDGKVIYDKDLLQIGKMTFSDPLYQSYPNLLDLAKKITQQPAGSGAYTFPAGPGQPAVNKSSEWTTISLHSTEWRLIISKVKS
jgi:hypothetical protein